MSINELSEQKFLEICALFIDIPLMTITQWQPFLNPRWRPSGAKFSKTPGLIV